MPLYTLVRLSATATTNGWYETNVPPPAGSEPTTPQWARDMSQKIEVAVPADMHLKGAFGGSSDSEDDSEKDGSDGSDGSDDDDDDDDDDGGSDNDDGD